MIVAAAGGRLDPNPPAGASFVVSGPRLVVSRLRDTKPSRAKQKTRSNRSLARTSRLAVQAALTQIDGLRQKNIEAVATVSPRFPLSRARVLYIKKEKKKKRKKEKKKKSRSRATGGLVGL